MKFSRRELLKRLMAAGGASALIGASDFLHIVPIGAKGYTSAEDGDNYWYPPGVPPFVERPPIEQPVPPGVKCNTDLAISFCTSRRQKYKIRRCASDVLVSLCTGTRQKGAIDNCATPATISKCTSTKQHGAIDSCANSFNISQCTSTKQKRKIKGCQTDLLISKCTSSKQKGRINDP